MNTVPVTEADVEQFRRSGFVVLREAFDADELADEVDAALARGFAALGHADADADADANVSAEAGISFRYLPMMSDRTPVSLDLLRRFGVAAERLLDGAVLPVRAKAVEYHGGSSWHRDSELAVASVGFACYLEPLTADTGALRVVPGSHLPSDAGNGGGSGAGSGAGSGEGRRPVDVDVLPAAQVAVETRPGDAIVFDEHLVHASTGGGVRRQWRVDYLSRPTSPAGAAVVRRYFEDMFSPDWDGGYDVDTYPTYGPHWRRFCDAHDDALLLALGAYDAAGEEEAASRRRS